MKQEATVKKKTISTVINGTAHRVSEVLYDAASHEIKQVSYSPEDNIVSLTSSTYDHNGYLLTRATDDKTGGSEQQWTYEHKFDETGKPAVKAIIKKGSKTIITESFLYEDSGNYTVTTREDNEPVEISNYSAPGVKLKWINIKNNISIEFIYDMQGHITEQKETRSGKPVRVIKYNNEYDNAGRLISTATGNTVTYYHYNSEDKLKEEISTQNGTRVSVITYDYEYW